MKKLFVLSAVFVSLFATPISVLSQDKTAISATHLGKYYQISEALVKGNPAGAAKSAKELADLLKTAQKPGGDQAGKTADIQKKISQDLNTIAGTKDLEKQRAAFQTLSDTFIAQIKTEKQDKPAYVIYCPMKKAYWISAVEEVRNPYYGNAMLTCGSVSETVK